MCAKKRLALLDPAARPRNGQVSRLPLTDRPDRRTWGVSPQ